MTQLTDHRANSAPLTPLSFLQRSGRFSPIGRP
jgi:hypothetical protein